MHPAYMVKMSGRKRMFYKFTAVLWCGLIALIPSQAVPAEFTEDFLLNLSKACRGKVYNNSAVDYRAQEKQRHIRSIERNHFNENVRRGIKGQTGSLMGDLDFLLRNVPNHYPALNVVADYYMSGRKAPEFPGTDCYFLRAMHFTPDDGLVPLAYGVVLARLGRHEDAKEQFNASISKLMNPAEAHYNLALLLLQEGDVDSAVPHAEAAYRRGYPLQGLRRKLADLGVDIE